MKKRYDRLLSLTLFGSFALLAFVLQPVYLKMMTNVVLFKDTLIPQLLSYVNGIVRMLADLLAYALIFYCAYKFTLKNTKNQITIAFCALAFYCVSNIVSTLIFQVGLDIVYYWDYFQWDELLGYFAYTSLLPFAIDIALYTVILGVGLYIINKNASKECLPIRSVFSFSNPLQKAIGWGALVLSVSQIIEGIVFDFMLGAPESSREVLEMFGYYLTEVLTGVVAYFVMLGLIWLFHSRNKKEKADA